MSENVESSIQLDGAVTQQEPVYTGIDWYTSNSDLIVDDGRGTFPRAVLAAGVPPTSVLDAIKALDTAAGWATAVVDKAHNRRSQTRYVATGPAGVWVSDIPGIDYASGHAELGSCMRAVQADTRLPFDPPTVYSSTFYWTFLDCVNPGTNVSNMALQNVTEITENYARTMLQDMGFPKPSSASVIEVDVGGSAGANHTWNSTSGNLEANATFQADHTAAAAPNVWVIVATASKASGNWVRAVRFTYDVDDPAMAGVHHVCMGPTLADGMRIDGFSTDKASEFRILNVITDTTAQSFISDNVGTYDATARDWTTEALSFSYPRTDMWLKGTAAYANVTPNNSTLASLPSAVNGTGYYTRFGVNLNRGYVVGGVEFAIGYGLKGAFTVDTSGAVPKLASAGGVRQIEVLGSLLLAMSDSDGNSGRTVVGNENDEDESVLASMLIRTSFQTSEVRAPSDPLAETDVVRQVLDADGDIGDIENEIFAPAKTHSDGSVSAEMTFREVSNKVKNKSAQVLHVLDKFSDSGIEGYGWTITLAGSLAGGYTYAVHDGVADVTVTDVADLWLHYWAGATLAWGGASADRPAALTDALESITGSTLTTIQSFDQVADGAISEFNENTSWPTWIDRADKTDSQWAAQCMVLFAQKRDDLTTMLIAATTAGRISARKFGLNGL